MPCAESWRVRGCVRERGMRVWRVVRARVRARVWRCSPQRTQRLVSPLVRVQHEQNAWLGQALWRGQGPVQHSLANVELHAGLRCRDAQEAHAGGRHAVREGERVKLGQVIGAVGATGHATGPHLDYRISKNGMKFDPLAVLSVPSSVPTKAGSAVQMAVAVQRGTKVASNALPKRPMVIQVR